MSHIRDGNAVVPPIIRTRALYPLIDLLQRALNGDRMRPRSEIRALETDIEPVSISG